MLKKPRRLRVATKKRAPINIQKVGRDNSNVNNRVLALAISLILITLKL